CRVERYGCSHKGTRVAEELIDNPRHVFVREVLEKSPAEHAVGTSCTVVPCRRQRHPLVGDAASRAQADDALLYAGDVHSGDELIALQGTGIESLDQLSVGAVVQHLLIIQQFRVSWSRAANRSRRIRSQHRQEIIVAIARSRCREWPKAGLISALLQPQPD